MTCKVRVTAEELNYNLIKQTSGGNITRLMCGIRASQFGEMRGVLVLCVAILAACENTEDPERSSSHIDHQEPQTEFIRSTKSAWRIPEQYLVVLKEGARDSHVQRTMHSLRAQAARSGHTVHIMHTYSGALCGFLIKMTSEVLPLALKLPHVAYIEEDSSIFAQGIPWNLERIIQTKHESGKYTPPNAPVYVDDGARVSVFLLDTSVRMNHREIEGKVMVTDFDSVPEEDGVRVHRQASQCDSHGTHIAGVLSGRDSGVARGVSVNIVRVLNCQGRGSVSGALAGLEYIHASLQVQPVSPVIILLPFVGGFSRTLNTACQEMVQSGAVLIAAAGNYQDDACMYSPASEPEVITVGATNAADQPLSSGTTGTNLGRCVDLFAPGDDIISSSSDCPTCFTSKSGTSQAAAHVAGIAAVLLNAHPGTSPAEVLQLLRYHSVQHVFNPASLPSEHHLTNPDMVAALPTSATTGEKLLCRSVWSKRSGVGSSDTAAARCRRDEEMFSCSSYSINGVHARERIELQDGQKVCEAHHGTGKEGVYAVARCCTGSSVKCQATASVHVGMDAECPNREYQLTGCSSHYIRAPDVAEPSWSLYSNRKACPAGEGGTSHAYCCHAPNLECHLIDHHQAEPIKQVEVSCEDSWTLTGCNVIPHGSVTHGAYMRGNTCVIQMFGGDKAATAITICCRYRPLDQQSSKTHEQNT